MFWVALWVLGLARGCGGEAPWSMPEAVRVGVAMASGLARERWVERRGSGGGESELLGAMLRLLGVDSKKVPEFAFEGFISLVHLMCRALIPEGGTERQPEGGRRFSLFRFIVERPQVADLLSRMQDPELVEQVLQQSKEKLKEFPSERVECLQLVACKTKPFVRGMQRSLGFFLRRENLRFGGEGARVEDEGADALWEEAGLEERMYFFLPSLTEVVEHGDRCDQLFPKCVY